MDRYVHFPIVALLLAALAVHVVHAAPDQDQTIIQNKNINIIVNLSPREMALELWKVLEGRLSGNPSRRSMSARSTVRELEEAVAPLLVKPSSSRRDGSRLADEPSITEVANELDRITRASLARDLPTRSTLDEEILARDIVAEMMLTLKKLLRDRLATELEDALLKRPSHVSVATRRMPESSLELSELDQQSDETFTLTLNIKRRDIESIVKALND